MVCTQDKGQKIQKQYFLGVKSHYLMPKNFSKKNRLGDNTLYISARKTLLLMIYPES
jgi:hypothetical protein